MLNVCDSTCLRMLLKLKKVLERKSVKLKMKGERGRRRELRLKVDLLLWKRRVCNRNRRKVVVCCFELLAKVLVTQICLAQCQGEEITTS